MALISVIVHHYAPTVLASGSALRNAALYLLDLGGLGVDLFFALSGFLITGILYDSKGDSDYFARFYWRRSVRIFPAYFAFLFPVLLLPTLFNGISRWWFILYLRNWAGPDSRSDGLLGHLWSLGVEEQFYIFWAVAVFLCSRRHLPLLIGLLCAAAPLFRVWMLVGGYPRYDIIRFTVSRMDGLLLGALVAVAWRRWDWRSVKRIAYWSTLLSASGIALVLAFSGINGSVSQATLSTCSAVFFASLLAVLLDNESRFLSSSALAHIAKYSYAMYLWHLAPQWFVASFMPQLLSGTLAKLLYVPILFASTYALSRLSWRYVEWPFLRLKDAIFASEICVHPIKENEKRAASA